MAERTDEAQAWNSHIWANKQACSNPKTVIPYVIWYHTGVISQDAANYAILFCAKRGAHFWSIGLRNDQQAYEKSHAPTKNLSKRRRPAQKPHLSISLGTILLVIQYKKAIFLITHKASSHWFIMNDIGACCGTTLGSHSEWPKMKALGNHLIRPPQKSSKIDSSYVKLAISGQCRIYQLWLAFPRLET